MSGFARKVARNAARRDGHKSALSGFKGRAMLDKFKRTRLPEYMAGYGELKAGTMFADLERQLLRRKPTAKTRRSRGGKTPQRSLPTPAPVTP